MAPNKPAGVAAKPLTPQPHAPATVRSSVLDQWREYENEFRGRSDLASSTRLNDFFSRRPFEVAQRLFTVATTLREAQEEWQSQTNVTDTTDPAKAQILQKADPAVLARAQKLCKAVASLGPVAVKVGQTLSQRPDLVGREASLALQRLTTQNEPYPAEWALAVMQEAYQNTHIAPGMGSGSQTPIFASITADPVACASLGQVYKATTYDGRLVAVKVQRPDAMATLALDWHCFRLVFALRQWLRTTFGGPLDSDEIIRGKQNVASVIDRVGSDILNELEYELEAQNAIEFQKALSKMLGFVTIPDAVPEYSHQRVLVTEWIAGRHLDAIEETQEGLAMTRMAVEACTASMVLTGLVHADPHQGNLMLHDDGRVVFLDFGLMTRVDDVCMESFARGIQALLAEDWEALTSAFVDVGFVQTPIMHRFGVNDTWVMDPKYGLSELAVDLEQAMDEVTGGKARFGALATVLNKKISPNWLVFTPPYVLLLIRTYLTLEGIAAQVDPTFNIYEMAMPWAVKRTLSPSTDEGIAVFRKTLLKEDNTIQWERLMDFAGKAATTESSPTDSAEHAIEDTTVREKKARQNAARSEALKDSMSSLMGSSDGKPLRRALYDLDSKDLIQRLSSKDTRPLLRRALFSATAKKEKEAVKVDRADLRPVSGSFVELRDKQARRSRHLSMFLIKSHLRRHLNPRGIFRLCRLTTVLAKVYVGIVLQRFFGRFRRSTSSTPSPVAVPA